MFCSVQAVLNKLCWNGVIVSLTAFCSVTSQPYLASVQPRLRFVAETGAAVHTGLRHGSKGRAYVTMCMSYNNLPSYVS